MISLSSKISVAIVHLKTSDVLLRLSQLPYLDAKHDYVWVHHQMSDVVCSLFFNTPSLHLTIIDRPTAMSR